ncbi:MAG: hypothetical protein O2U61_05155, partial [Candidatus Bathyarchaeota archaeon]|nr:hypothetical protein [Candidatus Bathyarchaeota archaeon]
MCGIWKLSKPYKSENELSLEKLENIVSDILFSKLEYINLNGGEPNLRDDLPEIVKLLIAKLPKLKTITLNSNGLPVDKAISNAEKISKICQEKNIRFSISISLHKIGKEYDEIAGIKNAYSKVRETLRTLK